MAREKIVGLPADPHCHLDLSQARLPEPSGRVGKTTLPEGSRGRQLAGLQVWATSEAGGGCFLASKHRRWRRESGDLNGRMASEMPLRTLYTDSQHSQRLRPIRRRMRNSKSHVAGKLVVLPYLKIREKTDALKQYKRHIQWISQPHMFTHTLE